MKRCATALLATLLYSGSGAVASEIGIASVFWEGSRLATGERFHPDEILCAHKSLPLRSSVRVTVVATGHSINCPILDRGPFVHGRILDLSRGAARALGVSGLAHVRVDF